MVCHVFFSVTGNRLVHLGILFEFAASGGFSGHQHYAALSRLLLLLARFKVYVCLFELITSVGLLALTARACK